MPSPAKKMTVTQVGEEQIHLVPRFSKIGGDVSRRSDRVVVLMAVVWGLVCTSMRLPLFSSLY